MVNQDSKEILNVDYKTIDQKWATAYLGTVINYGSSTTDHAIDYVNWVRKNHIQIEGSLTPEPSMIFMRDDRIMVRSQFKFRIKHYDRNEDIFSDSWFPEKTYQKNVWYEGYVDIPMLSNFYEPTYKDIKVDNNARLQRASKIWKMK